MIGQLLRHSAVYAAARVLLSAFDLLLLPLYTRLLSPDAYGLIALGAAVLAILALVYPLGLDSAFGRFFFDHELGSRAQRRTIGAIALAMSGIGLSVALALALLGPGVFANYLQGMSPRFFFLLVWTGYFGLFFPVWLNFLQARREPGRYLRYSMFQAGTRALLTILLVVVLARGADGWVEAYALSAAISAVVAITALGRAVTPVIDRAVLRQAFAYALPLFLHQLAGWAIAYAGRLILNQLGSLRDVGVYQVAFGIGSALGLVTTAINFAYAPAFMAQAARDSTVASKLFGGFASHYLAALATSGVLIALFAREIIAIVAPPAFAEAAVIVPVIVASFVTQGLYYVLANPIFFRKSLTTYLPLITMVGGLVSIGGSYVLVPKFGVIGVAWASLAASLVVAGATYPLSRYALPMRYNLRRALLAIAIGAAIIAISRWLPLRDSPIALVAADVALAGIYLAALFWSGVVDRAGIRAAAAAVAQRG